MWDSYHSSKSEYKIDEYGFEVLDDITYYDTKGNLTEMMDYDFFNTKEN